jgi:hypothetical protein
MRRHCGASQFQWRNSLEATGLLIFLGYRGQFNGKSAFLRKGNGNSFQLPTPLLGAKVAKGDSELNQANFNNDRCLFLPILCKLGLIWISPFPSKIEGSKGLPYYW